MLFKIVFFTLLVSYYLFAETVEIKGQVIHGDGSPIDSVIVELITNKYSTLTNQAGSFTLTDTIEISIQNSWPLPYSHIIPSYYSNSKGFISLTIQSLFQPLTFDIFTMNGKKLGPPFSVVLPKGVHILNPFHSFLDIMSTGLYILRIQSGMVHSYYKIMYTTKPLYQSFSTVSNKPKGIARHRLPIIDTLQFYKRGYSILKKTLDTLWVNIGTVSLSAFPTCKIQSPTQDQRINFGDSIRVSAFAHDNDGKIVSLSFFINGKLWTTKNGSPYSFVWNTIRNTIGTCSIIAEAIDNEGLKTRDSISVHIQSDGTKKFTYSILKTYSHDSLAFTQGLVFEDTVLYEGTGLRGESSLRKVEFETGKIVQQYNLPKNYFGEGITIYNNKIIQLTWTSNRAFVYEKQTFKEIESFEYTGEGWGITHDSTTFIMSNGSSYLYFLDLQTYDKLDSVNVQNKGTAITNLNELEYFYDKVFANIWYSDSIAMIDKKTGTIVGFIDCTGLLQSGNSRRKSNVLNGIAYDRTNDRVFVTGKLWPKLFEISLIPMQTPH